MKALEFLKTRMDKANFDKLAGLENPSAYEFLAEFVKLMNPKSIFIRTDSSQDIEYIRKRALELGEEKQLRSKGNTIHFDGVLDQARDKKNTKYLLKEGESFGQYINSTDREKGLEEVKGLLKGTMAGREMFVCFFCLGPLDSEFSILAMQITDSSYVAHSEDILYRPGYEEFKRKKKDDFFRFVHSSGEVDPQTKVSVNVDKRRVYIDLDGNTVYSANTQYAGNTVGLKKLSLRLAIKRASSQEWLAEHMFLMGVHNLKGEKAYFCGAYPSMCGKTSTAMITGETIIGDDIAYLRQLSGKAHAVNVERGIFGIIKDVNSKDDPILFEALTKEGETIFSNILIDDKNEPFWTGKDCPVPHEGVNFAGKWFPGKTDKEGSEYPASHKNARYTIRLSDLKNVDENLEDPKGVEVKGIIYGGRDSDTSCPVSQSLSWQHGVITKAASLESETTAATLGQEGVRVFNPMSNIDFVSILLGTYIKMHLDFGKKLKEIPFIFHANYFLRDKQGKFLNAIEDKRVWLKWMRLRVDRAVGALITPLGLIPKYEDLNELFRKVLNKDYAKDDYAEQFKLRIPENLAKIERIRNIYKGLKEIPQILFEELDKEEKRLLDLQKKSGDYISPFTFPEE